MIKAVFFDLDGTLLATSASRGLVAEMAAHVLSNAYPQLDRQTLVARIMEIAPGKPWRRGAGAVVEELGLQDTEAGRKAIAVWNFEGAEHLLTAVEGVIELIDDLPPHLTLGVITNGPEELQRRNFAPLKLDHRISIFVTSDRADAYKPDPRIFQFALMEAGVRPDEAVYIGDTFETDVLGALAAGMHAVWFNPNGHIVETADARYHEIRHFSDLAVVLEALSRE